ncbi:YveK family protein [Gottfriedia acidiceleris]|uniref:YveK family protein n=1 Tax=Gottfriedia acidiceleris TaxID=371036 RepID=UPI00101DECE0|nr:Wzz/FepE/Etk N-terminal domain-containing protein [Gottfriedia acidiceleris]
MENELSVKRIFELIKQRIWILVIFSIFFSALGGVYSYYFTKTQYETSSKLIVNATTPEMMNTLLVMIKEPTLLEGVVRELDLNISPEELSNNITPENVSGSQLVEIKVVNTDPSLAAQIANSTADVFVSQIPKILGFKDSKIYSSAQINEQPTNNDYIKKALLGLVVGIIAGVGVIFLLDFFDDTVKSEENTELLLGIPVFGTISKFNKRNTTLEKSEMIRLEDRGETYGNNEQKVISLN